jgi:hypothetical protein
MLSLPAPIQGDTMNRSLATLALCLLVGPAVFGQGRGGGPQAPRAPKAMAPFDMTGYWISVVSEDWRWRMFTPRKGDYTGVPLNAEGKKIADAWDPAKDEAAGEQCKSYGAANIMRVPGRLHITWDDEQTLKVETDAGTQTRVFSFGATNKAGNDWQGVSKVTWELTPAVGGFTFGPSAATDGTGSLKVVTTRVRPGYLRKNGVPYSANATVTEYYDMVKESDGDTYLIITTTVEDPTYLTESFLTAANFKKQATEAGWNPSPCSVR